MHRSAGALYFEVRAPFLILLSDDSSSSFFEQVLLTLGPCENVVKNDDEEGLYSYRILK